MNIIRQHHTVQGRTLLLHLPENFTAKRVEVIIMPEEQQDAESVVNTQSVAPERSFAEFLASLPPAPPLPVWTAEERREMLKLLENGPTLTEEEIAEWERDLEHIRSWQSKDWSNEE